MDLETVITNHGLDKALYGRVKTIVNDKTIIYLDYYVLRYWDIGQVYEQSNDAEPFRLNIDQSSLAIILNMFYRFPQLDYIGSHDLIGASRYITMFELYVAADYLGYTGLKNELLMRLRFTKLDVDIGTLFQWLELPSTSLGEIRGQIFKRLIREIGKRNELYLNKYLKEFSTIRWKEFVESTFFLILPFRYQRIIYKKLGITPPQFLSYDNICYCERDGWIFLHAQPGEIHCKDEVNYVFTPSQSKHIQQSDQLPVGIKKIVLKNKGQISPCFQYKIYFINIVEAESLSCW